MARSQALLIGVSQYAPASGLNTLQTPDRDARALAKILNEPASGFSEQCLTSPTCTEIRKAAELFFVKADPDDFLMFYFSGHGKLGQNGGLYLCPADMDAEVIDTTAVSLLWLRQVIDRSVARHIVIMLDCCYSGEAASAFKSDVASIIQASISPGRGKYLITSSADYQVSLERPGDENSLFTKWFLHGLATNEADLNSDRVITVDEIFRYTAENVQREQATQTPKYWKWGTSPGDAIIRGHTQPTLASVASTDPFFNAARGLLARNTPVIPFVGPGVFGRGPLSGYQIAGAMAAEAGLKSSNSGSATEIAQHLKNIYGDREQFLSVYGQIIRGQTPTVGDCTSHVLISRSIVSDVTNLIISFTHDCKLEELLRARNKKMTILSHVINSNSKTDIGKLLVLDFSPEPKYRLCLSDEWLPDSSVEIVIYKIVGSPCLSDYMKRSDLDTVVATEEDYGCLFGFFENEHRKAPSALSRWLQTRPAFFLGLGLDVWEYRLLANLFDQTVSYEAAGAADGRPRNSRRRRYAVREPTTPVETLSWQRLDIDLIKMDPDEFSKGILGEALTARTAS